MNVSRYVIKESYSWHFILAGHLTSQKTRQTRWKIHFHPRPDQWRWPDPEVFRVGEYQDFILTNLQFALWGFPATCSHHLTYLTVPHSPEPKSLEKLSLPFVPLCDINSEMCVSPSLLWCGGVGSGVPCLSLPSWFYPVQPCRTAWRAACTPPAGRGTATGRPGGGGSGQ